MSARAVYVDTDYANPYLASLVTGMQWEKGSTVTFYLAPSDVDGDGITDWNQRNEGTGLRKAYAAWAAVCDIKVKEVTSEAKANYSEHLVPVNSLPGAFANHSLPFTGTGEGNYEIDILPSDQVTLPGGAHYENFLHEIGHGLGLKHPHEEQTFPGVDNQSDPGDNNLNSRLGTVMSYVGASYVLTDSFSNMDWGEAKTPMAFDIAAVQAMYGANMSTKTGNDAWTLPTANKAGTGWACIWDAGGTDTIVNDGTADAVIDLRAATLKNEVGGAGFISKVAGVSGGFTIANGVVIENASGGEGRDAITGNSAANKLSGNGGDDLLAGGTGADTLLGGRGNDRLDGGAGADVLTGGKGADTFAIAAAADSTKKAPDRITDFTVGTDILDLDALRPKTASLSVKSGVTTVKASGIGGEVSFVLDGSYTLADLGIDRYLRAIHGTSGKDSLTGGTIDDLVWGYAGDDKVHGKDGADALWGEAGKDTLYGEAGNDALHGGTGDDKLLGAEGDDHLTGDTGNDRINAGLGHDVVDGGDGVDTLVISEWAASQPGVGITLDYASAHLGWDGQNTISFSNVEAFEVTLGSGYDSASGGELGDSFAGKGGNDWLYGWGGADTLDGGDGDDHLSGGSGRDVLTGGKGADTFAISSFNPTLAWWDESTVAAPDRITDFSQKDKDRIDLTIIDAKPGTGDDAFTFIGKTAFSGAGGELHYAYAHGITTISGDIDGDKTADFAIELDGKIKLLATDFVL